MTGPSRPRVALVTSGLGPAQGGIGVVAEMMARALAERCEVQVFRFHAQWPRALRVAELLSVTLARLLAFRPSFVLYDHVDLARLHEMVPLLRAKPAVVFLHGIELWRPLAGMRQKALERATVLLANSSFTVEAARRHNPWLPKTRVVWLAAAPPRAEARSAEREPLALVVGRMDPTERGKGHDQILDAWQTVKAAAPYAKLAIVGTGADRPRLEARVRNQGLSDVQFLGFIDDARRDELYRRARVFLFPSTQEGFGIAGVEAAAAGLPVVAVAGTVLEEIFAGDEGVRLAKDQSGPALAPHIIELLRDPTAAAALGARGRARAAALFTEAAFGSRLLEALEQGGLLRPTGIAP